MREETVKSARRVFEVFEVFARRRRGLALKDIMGELGYPASSASGLLKSMVALGVLDYDKDTHIYMPTLRMPQLVSWIEPARFADGRLLAAMQRLHDVTEETVCLGTQSDLYAQYIHSLQTALPTPFAQGPLTVRPLTGCGLGWLLLSAATNKRVDRIVRRINYEIRDSAKRVHLPDLMARIGRIRREGYVFSRHTVVTGGGMIGVLLPDAGPRRRLAISVHGPVDRLEAKHDVILAELRAAAMALGSAIAAVH